MYEIDNKMAAKIIEIVSGFAPAQILITATSLGVFSALADGPGLTAEQIAHSSRLDKDNTERLLNACVGLGFLLKTELLYRNTPDAAKFLNETSLDSIVSLVNRFGHVYTAFDKLARKIKHGSRTHQKQTLFEFGGGLYETEKEKTDFVRAMDIISSNNTQYIIQRFGQFIAQFKTICDIGGCSGVLAQEIVKANQGTKVFVIDLPQIIEYSTSLKKGPNLRYLAKDLFTDELIPTDLQIFSRMFHMWSDRTIGQALSNTKKYLNRGGYVLILDKMLDADKCGPKQTIFFDLAMCVTCDGRERTANEIKKLLEDNGFINIEIHPSISPSGLGAVTAMKS